MTIAAVISSLFASDTSYVDGCAAEKTSSCQEQAASQENGMTALACFTFINLVLTSLYYTIEYAVISKKLSTLSEGIMSGEAVSSPTNS